MESELDPRFIEHDITEFVVSFARSNPNGWFAASRVASQLNAPIDVVRRVLVQLTEQSSWLKAFVDYECPEHDFTLARKPFGEPVRQDELFTCTGNEEGHGVPLSPDYAMVVFEPTEALAQYAKKELGSQRIWAP